MNHTEKLASAVFIIKKASLENIKQSNVGNKIRSVLKTLGLIGGSGVAGGAVGQYAGYNRGFDSGFDAASKTSQKDLTKGLAMLLQEVAMKGREAK